MFGQNPYSAGAVPSEGQGEGKEGDPLQMGVILLWQGTGQGLGLGVPAGPETLRRDRVKRNTRAGGFCRTGGRGSWGLELGTPAGQGTCGKVGARPGWWFLQDKGPGGGG